jgi:hypothetical protein
MQEGGNRIAVLVMACVIVAVVAGVEFEAAGNQHGGFVS